MGPKFDRANLPRLVEIVGGPQLHRCVLMESATLEQSCAGVQKLLAERGLPKVPMIVLTADYRGKGAMAKAAARVNLAHAQVAALIGGELRTLAGISHSVPFEAPEAIAQGVRDLIAKSLANQTAVSRI
jgi:hypothetical protein